MVGTIQMFNETRGFGFLKSSFRTHFFHVSNWQSEQYPAKDTLVEFEIGPAFRGSGTQAINVRPAGEKAQVEVSQ